MESGEHSDIISMIRRIPSAMHCEIRQFDSHCDDGTDPSWTRQLLRTLRRACIAQDRANALCEAGTRIRLVNQRGIARE